ncbi:MAG TPA: N-acetylmuramic acid 6-phosphate etherase [Pyrinomonadaceae bacterium]|jgi:N-acetylmuramic acid 6-phosphate etherase|nr:N-acetylmuramic acid 6-phosphate etherase [Pyrinomonadaceae bacterium]
MPAESSPVPVTEQENPRTSNFSSLSSLEITRAMNEEDASVAPAIQPALPAIAETIDRVVDRLRNSGRLFYIGTGTSGRLGVLDAAECPPTFGVPADLVQAVIAGGYEACYRAVEASEDDVDAGAHDLQARAFSARDALIGIAASGRTPYTVGAVDFARQLGAFTGAITCVPDSPITQVADVPIVAVVGPEVVAGSTRLKAGTAQKMILNMISTATMVRLGYVSGNRMTNVHTRNTKLRARAVRILMTEAGVDEALASEVLDAAEGALPVAIVMVKTESGQARAKAALDAANGVIVEALKIISSENANR